MELSPPIVCSIFLATYPSPVLYQSRLIVPAFSFGTRALVTIGFIWFINSRRGSEAGKCQAGLLSLPLLHLIALLPALSKPEHTPSPTHSVPLSQIFQAPGQHAEVPRKQEGPIALSWRPAAKPSSPGVRRPSTSNLRTFSLTARRQG